MARLTKNVKAKPPALRLVDLPCQVLLQVSSHLDGSNVGRFETSSAAISGVLRDAGAGPAVWDLLFRLTDATSPATRRAVDAVNGGGRQTALRRAKLMFLDPRPTHTHAQMCAQTARGIRPRLPELTHIRIFKIAGFKLVVEAAYRIIWLGKPVEDHRSDDEEEAPAETPMTKKKGQ